MKSATYFKSLRRSTVRLTKIRLIISTLVLIGLVGAVYSYDIHQTNKQAALAENSPTGGSSLQVTSARAQSLGMGNMTTGGQSSDTSQTPTGTMSTGSSKPATQNTGSSYNFNSAEASQAPSAQTTPTCNVQLKAGYDSDRANALFQENLRHNNYSPPAPTDSSYWGDLMDIENTRHATALAAIESNYQSEIKSINC